MSWKDRFNQHALKFEDTEFLQHVSKTVNGKAINSQQFSAIISSIVRALQPSANAELLDLCCGNGVVTKQLAGYWKSVKAIDFSNSLVQIALKHNHLANIEYYLESIFRIKNILSQSDSLFEGICMYEALQCFSKKEYLQILLSIKPYCASNTRVMFGSVPDQDRIWNFYDSEERREEYFRRVEDGTEAIGSWWKKSEIATGAEQLGFAVEFLEQPSILHTAHYRFDVLLQPTWK